MFDEDSLFIRAFGWLLQPALAGILGWLLVWVAGAGIHGVAVYAALGAVMAYARAGFGWPPNNNDWAPLAGIIWPLVALRDVLPHLLRKREPQTSPLPTDLSTNVAFLDPPRPRLTA